MFYCLSLEHERQAGVHEVGGGYLAEDSGLKPRVVQIFTDAGVLKAVPGTDRMGRGNHRLYQAAPPFHGERTWARIAGSLSRLRLPVGTILRIVESMRYGTKIPKTEPDMGWQRWMRGSPIGLALLGEPVWLAITEGENDEYTPYPLYFPKAESVQIATIPEDDLEVPDDHVPAEISGRLLLDNPREAYLLNLTAILQDLRAT